MDIYEIMDCVDCPSYRHHTARLTPGPYYSGPDESGCSDGDFGNDHVCDRMTGAIKDMISDGQLETATGYFIDRDWAAQIQRGDADCDVDPWFMDFDFSSAPFWWVPDTYAPGETDGGPKPYRSEQEVWREWFS